MMQRTIGAFIANKIKDEIFKPNATDEDGNVDESYVDPLDGELIYDDNGRALGKAYRIPDIAVYVVAGRNAYPDAELERAINDENSELIIHREGRQITALVYIPDQSTAAPPPQSSTRGFRADDV